MKQFIILFYQAEKTTHEMKFSTRILSISYFIFLFGANACTNPTQENLRGNNRLVQQAERITLIFLNKPSVKKEYRFKNGITAQAFEPATLYFDDNQVGVAFTPRANDTITLTPKKEYIVVKQRIDPYNFTEHVLHKGDTAVFNYPKGYPELVINNDPEHNVAQIYEKPYKSSFLAGELAPVPMYFHADMYIDWSKPDVQAQIKKSSDAKYGTSLKFLEQENKLLDSLKKENKISPAKYTFYKDKDKYLLALINLKESKLSMDDILLITNSRNTNYSYLAEQYRKRLIESAVDKFLVSKARPLDIKDGINRDYRQSYIFIRDFSGLNELDKNWLLTREMRRIANTFSGTDTHKFYEYYKRDVSDTSMVNDIKKEYALIFNTANTDANSIALLKSDGRRLSFETLKGLYAGKIIYIDFWASWCAPCRDIMPSSLRLKDRLKGKKIVFIYLSIDKTIKPWLDASAQEKLDKYENNYLIANYSSSEFLKRQKMTSIPRYMIFDKKGKLAYANAPGAESKDLLPLLLQMME